MSTKQSKTELVISAVDKASATLNEIGERLDRVAKPAGNLAKAFGNLWKASGIAGVKAAAGGLSKSMKELATNTVGIGGVYAGTVASIVGFGVSAAGAANNVRQLAEKYQVHANSIQVFGSMVEEGGGSMEDAAAAMGKLKKNMQLAMHGGKEQAEAFRGVGISIAELKNLSADQVLERMAGAFHGSDKDLAKQAVLLSLMGRSGEVFMSTLNRGADGVSQKFAEMRADGRLLSQEQLDQAGKFHKAWKRMHGTFDGIKAMLGLRLAEKLQPMIEKFQAMLVDKRSDISAAFDKFLEKLPTIIEIGIDLFKGLWGVVQIVLGAFKAMNTVFGSTGSTLILLSGLMSPVIVAAGKLAWSIGVMVYKMGSLAMQALPAVMAGLRAVWAIMMANPIMAILAAVSVLAMMVIAHWDEIVDAISSAWDRIKSVFEVDFFAGLVQTILEIFQGMANGILGIVKTILPFLPDIKFDFAERALAVVKNSTQEPANSTDNKALAQAGAVPANRTTTAADVAKIKTEVGGTLKIFIEGANARVTELKQTGGMTLNVHTGMAMAGG